MADITLYTKPTCPYCSRAKELLRSKGEKFQNIDISAQPDRRAEMIQRSGGRTTVPQIFINGQHIGGCDDLMELDERGALDALLQGQTASP